MNKNALYKASKIPQGRMWICCYDEPMQLIAVVSSVAFA